MPLKELDTVIVQQKKIYSAHLKRKVTVDLYIPTNFSPSNLSLLLVNDGQDLVKIKFAEILNELYLTNQITSILCAGIHTGERLMEYGTAHVLDFKGRGGKAFLYQQFLTEELLPLLHIVVAVENFKAKSIAGFSLGGLSAFDTFWNHPEIFSMVGVFSASLWWRTKDLEEGYEENADKIMHQKVRQGEYYPGKRFYFTTGTLDETADRNNNGIIDSIDDTADLIEELKHLGYDTDYDIKYVNYEDGRHDIQTWRKALPQFLLWGWGRK